MGMEMTESLLAIGARHKRTSTVAFETTEEDEGGGRKQNKNMEESYPLTSTMVVLGY